MATSGTSWRPARPRRGTRHRGGPLPPGTDRSRCHDGRALDGRARWKRVQIGPDRSRYGNARPDRCDFRSKLTERLGLSPLDGPSLIVRMIAWTRRGSLRGTDKVAGVPSGLSAPASDAVDGRGWEGMGGGGLGRVLLDGSIVRNHADGQLVTPNARSILAIYEERSSCGSPGYLSI
jgi:hypothetical protein